MSLGSAPKLQISLSKAFTSTTGRASDVRGNHDEDSQGYLVDSAAYNIEQCSPMYLMRESLDFVCRSGTISYFCKEHAFRASYTSILDD